MRDETPPLPDLDTSPEDTTPKGVKNRAIRQEAVMNITADVDEIARILNRSSVGIVTPSEFASTMSDVENLLRDIYRALKAIHTLPAKQQVKAVGALDRMDSEGTFVWVMFRSLDTSGPYRKQGVPDLREMILANTKRFYDVKGL